MPNTTLSQALTDLLFDDALSVEEAVEKHYHPDFTQRTNGAVTGRAEFVQHMAVLRGMVESGSVTVHQEFVDGDGYGEHHTVNGVRKDGGAVVMEVFAFGRFADDGRFVHLDEATVLVAGEEADKELSTIS